MKLNNRRLLTLKLPFLILIVRSYYYPNDDRLKHLFLVAFETIANRQKAYDLIVVFPLIVKCNNNGKELDETPCSSPKQNERSAKNFVRHNSLCA